jgi:rhodanese-related sulfurtransferase
MKIIGHRELIALRNRGAQVIETLPASEYNAAHIAGAIHMPLRRLPGKAAILSRERPVVAYCRDSL